MIRDVFAAVIAVVLLFVVMRLATTLTYDRKRRRQEREAQRALGRAVIVEIPTDEGLVLFTDDATRFYYGDRVIDKTDVTAVRVLINGSPIAAVVSPRHRDAADRQPTSFEDRPEGIARDRWDVAIETVNGTTLVECGAIRERISQELARAVFDAVKRALPPVTTPFRERRRDD